MYEGESNENLKSYNKLQYKYLRFSFDLPSYICLIQVCVKMNNASLKYANILYP